jgi:hypothetical protein
MALPSIVCSLCGYAFLQGDQANACPRCGGTARTYHVELTAQSPATAALVAHKSPRTDPPSETVEVFARDSVSVADKAIIHGTGGSGEAIRINDSKGESVTADQEDDGSVHFGVKGTTRQGESGNLEVCRILIDRLNRDGERWEEPIASSGDSRKEDGVDCKAYDGDRVLNVQITRAHRHPDLWRDLARFHKVTVPPTTADNAADDLLCAITEKASNKIVTPGQRQELVLALDATQTPIHVFQDVVRSFLRRHGSWARGLGFRGIWVIGPTAEITFRLDTKGPEHVRE